MSKLGNWFREKGQQIKNWWNSSKFVKDLTGQTAIDQQNTANLELAKYQAQMNEDFYNKYSSPEALMRQYKEAGLNPNLVYGSLGSGQGNVPSFNAPQVERNLSGADKINKALSSLSAGLGLVQNVYQVAAARESAQQSTIKTLDDIVNLQRNKGNLNYDDLVKGGLYSTIKMPEFRLFRSSTRKMNEDYYAWPSFNGSRFSFLKRYAGADRALHMNKALDSAMSNIYKYGYGNYGLTDTLHKLDSGLMPYQKSLNLSNQLKYQLSREIGNTGTYGKLLLSALGLFL